MKFMKKIKKTWKPPNIVKSTWPPRIIAKNEPKYRSKVLERKPNESEEEKVEEESKNVTVSFPALIKSGSIYFDV